MVLLALMSMVVAACATEQSGSEPTEPTVTGVSTSETAPSDEEIDPPSTSAFPLSVHRTDPGSGMAAIVTGIVEVDVDLGCVWLSQPDGSRAPAVWPVGTTAFMNPFSIVLTDGQIVQEGDRVEGGGGYVPANSAAGGFTPFPAECVQTGEMAVFNAGSTITVTPGVGLDVGDTLFTRFRPPAPVGLELIAVNPNQKSVAVVDFVTGTVHLYGTGDYTSPVDALDGASGGGGFIHLWAGGTVYSYPGAITTEPIVYQPEPLRTTDGIAPALTVVPGLNERTWLVQPPIDGGPTLVELVDLVEEQVTRLGTFEVDGDWRGVGVTRDGLIVESGSGGEAALIDETGTLLRTVGGQVLSVGPNGVVLVSSGGTITITDSGLGPGPTIPPPAGADWTPIGGPVIPSNAPPLVTGGSRYLVLRATQGDEPSGGALVVVEQNSLIAPIASTSFPAPLAAWSRAEDWIVFVEGDQVTLIPADGGQPVPLGALIPEDHWVLSAG